MAELKALLEQKKEYTTYLQDTITESLIHEFQTIYDKDAMRTPKVLQSFQEAISKIPEWNNVAIQNCYARIAERTACSFLPDLVRAIFTTYVKVHLLSHGAEKMLNKVKLKVPSIENFLHRCMIQCARSIWKQPYLFYHAVRTIERQHNLTQVEDLFRKAIVATIRSCIPMDQLLAISVADPRITQAQESDNEEGSSESEEESAEIDEGDVSEEEEDVSEEESEKEEDEEESKEADVESEDEDSDVAIIQAIEDEESETDEDDSVEADTMVGAAPVETHVEEESKEPEEVVVEAAIEDVIAEEDVIKPVEEELKANFTIMSEDLESELDEPEPTPEDPQSDEECENVIVEPSDDEEVPVIPSVESREQLPFDEVVREKRDLKVISLRNMLLNKHKMHRKPRKSGDSDAFF